MKSRQLKNVFFDRDAQTVAQDLLGKVLRVKYRNIVLSAQIIETEAYYIHEKASHSSLGYTEKRKALFMPAGTIYMYYARGADSLNFSCHGEGNAVLVKAGFPYLGDGDPEKMIATMQRLNPPKNGEGVRPIHKLCSGQTLLCKSLNLKVTQWDKKTLIADRFYLEDVDYTPKKILQTTRLGIPRGRDEHLPYRFIDADFYRYCTVR